jgi:hypothetical protein
MKKASKGQKERLSSSTSRSLPPAKRTPRSSSSGAGTGQGAAMRTKPAKGAEYRLLIAPHFNEREQRYKTLFQLETTQLFSNFKYDLSVEEQIEGKHLYYSVLSLKTPLLSLPSSGRAQYTREYDDLRGTYEVTVAGLDGSTSSFTVRIAAERVTLVKKPSNGFIDVIVEEAHWSST